MLMRLCRIENQRTRAACCACAARQPLPSFRGGRAGRLKIPANNARAGSLEFIARARSPRRELVFSPRAGFSRNNERRDA